MTGKSSMEICLLACDLRMRRTSELKRFTWARCESVTYFLLPVPIIWRKPQSPILKVNRPTRNKDASSADRPHPAGGGDADSGYTTRSVVVWDHFGELEEGGGVYHNEDSDKDTQALQ